MKHSKSIKFPFNFYLIRSLSVVTERSRSRVETLLNSCQFLNCNSCVVTERSRSAGRIHHIILNSKIPFFLSFLCRQESIYNILNTEISFLLSFLRKQESHHYLQKYTNQFKNRKNPLFVKF